MPSTPSSLPACAELELGLLTDAVKISSLCCTRCSYRSYLGSTASAIAHEELPLWTLSPQWSSDFCSPSSITARLWSEEHLPGDLAIQMESRSYKGTKSTLFGRKAWAKGWTRREHQRHSTRLALDFSLQIIMKMSKQTDRQTDENRQCLTVEQLSFLHGSEVKHVATQYVDQSNAKENAI